MDFDKLRNWYSGIDWDSLKKSQFGEAGDLSPVAEVFVRIQNSFDFLLNSVRNKRVPPEIKGRIVDHLRKFAVLVDEINRYTDAAKREQVCDSVRAFEYGLQGAFSDVFPYFLVQLQPKQGTKDEPSLTKEDVIELINVHQSPSGLKKNDVINLIQKSIPNSELENAKNIAEYLLSKKKDIDEALDVSQKITKSNEQLVKSILEANAADATSKAKEHRTFYIDIRENYLVTRVPIVKSVFNGILWLFPFFGWIGKFPLPRGTYVWLLSSVASGSLVLLIVWYFIQTGGEVSVGNAILRISAIVVPSYFAVFFSKQFLSHKKLYEFYMFKQVASQTMLSLRSQFAKGSYGDEKVIEKGLNVLFSEPSLGDRGEEVDKALLKDMINLLMKKIDN